MSPDTSRLRKRAAARYGVGVDDPSDEDLARALMWEAAEAGGAVWTGVVAGWRIVASDVDWLEERDSPEAMVAFLPRSFDAPHGAPIEAVMVLLGRPFVSAAQGGALLAFGDTDRSLGTFYEVLDEVTATSRAALREARRIIAIGPSETVEPADQTLRGPSVGALSQAHSARHVLPDKSGGWRVENEGALRASALAPTARQAVERAREIVAHQGGGTVVVHTRGGAVSHIVTVHPPPR